MSEQKIPKKVAFEQPHPDSPTEVAIRLAAALAAHSLEPLSDTPDPEDPPLSSKSIRPKPHSRELSALQILLARELTNSLDVIISEVFDEEGDEDCCENGTQCLLIFLGLLRTQNLGKGSQVLKRVYDLTTLSALPQPMELATLLAALKKRLVRLGFAALGRVRGERQGEVEGEEGEFREAVAQLIRLKEEAISQLQYEICRVCESYVPLSSIAAHLNQCEQAHQKQYLECKLEERGRACLEVIGDLAAHSQEKYDLRMFFDRVYRAIGERSAVFVLKDDSQEIELVIQQYSDGYHLPIYKEVLEQLASYLEILNRSAVCGETLSDKDSKAGSRSRKLIGFDRAGSFTSLLPSQTTEHAIASERTILSESQARGKLASCRLADFEVLQRIGQGSYSEVYLVRKKNTQDLFAMKVIEIAELDEGRLTAFRKEQRIYRSIKGGSNVKLYYSFSEDNLYFLLLDYCCGGNLRTLLENEVYLPEGPTRTYLANLVLAVDAIHRLGILHRDLKPDNIVINERGQLVLTDFNLSKLIKDDDHEKPNSFFGTPDYIAPQVLRGTATNEMVDWFSLGVIAYQMVIGVTPFTDTSPQAVFDNILKGEVEWPEAEDEEDGVSPVCRDFITQLLQADPAQRLGANGLQEIQNHPFFAGVSWNLSQQSYFYVPNKPQTLNEDVSLLYYIQSKKRKSSIKFIPGDSIVRYDILKSITNKNVRSHRNSRFKLEKELEALKTLPSAQSVRLKKHNSSNYFTTPLEETQGISCKDFFEQQ